MIVRLLGTYKGGTAKAASDADDVGWFSIDELDSVPLRPGIRELVVKAMTIWGT